MGRRAKTDDERMEEWIADASVDSLKRMQDLVAFALKLRAKYPGDTPDDKPKQAKLPGV